MQDSINREYTKDWLQYKRPQPMYDKSINKFYDDFYKENPVHTHDLDNIFKEKFINWLDSHTLNSFTGYEKFKHLDICIGCTQFIDDIYQRLGQENIMIFENDYKYHWRLNNNINYTTLNTLSSTKELIIAMPFPYGGDMHPKMQDILDGCYSLNIPVHIDGAWISCCRDIIFDFNHPAIHTFAISLSKGGLGGNRIGVRFSKKRPEGAITIMNDFNMNCQSLVSMGIKFIETFGTEYFWKQYESKYKTVCNDFNLLPTKVIHLAKTLDETPVGIRPLLRCL